MTHFERTVLHDKPISLAMMAEGKVGARLASFRNGVQAIMKVGSALTMKEDRKTQRDLPTRTLPQREVAFYRLARALGFTDVVPETVLGTFADFPTSFQEYATAAKLYDVEPRLRQTKNRTQWGIAIRETLRDVVPIEDTIRLTVLDWLAASRDRHGANYGAKLDTSGEKARWRLIGWDNGCTFGLTQTLYHCVAHKHLFRYAFDLSAVWRTLQQVKREQIVGALSGLISDEAIDHVWIRLQFMLTFPHRMPFATLSNGNYSSDAFPSYAELFKPMVAQQPLYILQAQA